MARVLRCLFVALRRSSPGISFYVIIGLWLLGGSSIGCASDEGGPALDVFAAASVADTVEAIAASYSEATRTRVRVSRGASGVLCQQIENGAACDVFIPANPQFIERLAVHDGTTVSNKREVATNRMVLIVRKGFVFDQDHSSDADESARRRIVAALERAQRVAIANVEHAPAGRYARQVIDALKMRGRLESKLVYADDVRLTSQYVADGAVDCGFVYLSDAKAFEGRIGGYVLVPAGLHESIAYDACVVSRADDAAAFVAFLVSEKAARIWRAYGFGDVSGGTAP
ncbi:MAG: molybdate ABC transporter substrate-binding protein [Phycisphaerales bacterium]|nr:molybdate ABC transporter substrate-binding protein [Phycisphaerales bacterium]